MAFRDPRELMAAAGGVLPTDPRNERFPMYEIQPRGIGVEALQGIGGAFAAVQGEKVATLQAIREAQAKARAAALEYQREVEKMQKEQGLITDREKLKIASDEKLETTKQAAENERALADAMIRGQFKYTGELPADLSKLDPRLYRYIPTSHFSTTTTVGGEPDDDMKKWIVDKRDGARWLEEAGASAGLYQKVTDNLGVTRYTYDEKTASTLDPNTKRVIEATDRAFRALQPYVNIGSPAFLTLAERQAAAFDRQAKAIEAFNPKDKKTLGGSAARAKSAKFLRAAAKSMRDWKQTASPTLGVNNSAAPGTPRTTTSVSVGVTDDTGPTEKDIRDAMNAYGTTYEEAKAALEKE